MKGENTTATLTVQKASGISAVNADTLEGEIYNVKGVRMQGNVLRSGLYISKGQKTYKH